MALSTINTLQNIYRFNNKIIWSPTWTQSTSNNTVSYNSLSNSGENAIASGPGTGIWYSINSGVNWSKSAGSNILSTGDYTVIISGLNGFASCASTTVTQRFLRTTNGGSSWVKITQGDNNDRTINAHFLVGLNGIYASIAANNIYYTTNAGSSWTISSGTAIGAFNLLYMAGNYCLASTSSSGTNRVAGIFYSSNLGVSWTKSSSLGTSYFTKILIDSAGIGFATPSTGTILYRSSDGGINWSSNLSDVKRIVAMDNNKVIAVSTDSSAVIKYSNDKGLNWNNSNYSAQCSNIVIKGNNCIAITSAGGIIISKNGGIDWETTTLTNIVSITKDKNIIVSKTNSGVYYSNNIP